MPSPPSTLIVILDTHPLAWHLLSRLPPAPPLPDNKIVDNATSSPTSLDQFMTILIVFLNAHLASKWGNEVVVYTASAGKAELIYPLSNEKIRQRGEGAKPSANMYRPFQVLDERIEEGLKEVVREEEGKLHTEGPGFINEPPAMVSALTKALCFINRRISPSVPTDPTALPPSSDPNNNTSDTSGALLPSKEVRILVINATPGAAVGGRADPDGDSEGGHGTEKENGDASEEERKSQRQQQRMRGGYVGLMNCVFAAQKAKVPIDILSLPPSTIDSSPPVFLQQAAHLTDGVYWQWNGRGGLLQYLHSIYLTPPSLRHNPFVTPPQDAVNFRAVCFCHHRTLDVGFVCSVCLSIFCEPKPICAMCKTRFPIKSIPRLRTLAGLNTRIQVPDTVVKPPAPKSSSTNATGGRAGVIGGKGDNRGEPIVID
ncbi:transcription initiation factor TFIIH subunit 3 [Cryptococcus neoformans Tu401-1]|nr:transcription initiation factor TFIIH subunit 3 [Cryptococcus neoformans var. grubii Bt85]OXG11755.1 transcription initiation factor TFIIH subunit 3 [Cryptococcus neoformans var. grubii Tu401-1]OXM76276.1 transcription initiation factor TFIIH subunit 3 [Cryptococcus neoformans var. grubii Bt63]